jgi:hypothetical protein
MISSTEPYAKTQKNNLNPTSASDVTLLLRLFPSKDFNPAAADLPLLLLAFRVTTKRIQQYS